MDNHDHGSVSRQWSVNLVHRFPLLPVVHLFYNAPAGMVSSLMEFLQQPGIDSTRSLLYILLYHYLSRATDAVVGKNIFSHRFRTIIIIYSLLLYRRLSTRTCINRIAFFYSRVSVRTVGIILSDPTATCPRKPTR